MSPHKSFCLDIKLFKALIAWKDETQSLFSTRYKGKGQQMFAIVFKVLQKTLVETFFFPPLLLFFLKRNLKEELGVINV